MSTNDQDKKAWQHGMEKLPQAVGDFEVERDNIGLLFVDTQNYDTRPDCGIGKIIGATNPEVAEYVYSRLKEMVIPNCVKLLEFFRKNQLRVFYAAFGASMPDGSDMLTLRKMRLKEVPAFTTESFEYQIIDELGGSFHLDLF